MFFKTASAPIIAVLQSSGKHHKVAHKTADLSPEEDSQVKRTLNLLSPDFIKAVAAVYNLSSDIDDYIFPIPRAVTANKWNNNGDLFTDDELSRFSNDHRCQVYQTFKNDPIHVEHVAFDPKAARGFIPDVHYVQTNPNDMHVITVAAIDTTKDSPMAEGILNGSLDSWSMGCICEEVQCSECNKIAKSDNDLCECLKFNKMSNLTGIPVHEKCLGVEFQELSVVGMPADPTAITQLMLQRHASKAIRRESNRINKLDGILETADQVEVAKYFRANINKMPESMVKLAHNLFK